jgi:hypothetical protein
MRISPRFAHSPGMIRPESEIRAIHLSPVLIHHLVDLHARQGDRIFGWPSATGSASAVNGTPRV